VVAHEITPTSEIDLRLCRLRRKTFAVIELTNFFDFFELFDFLGLSPPTSTVAQ
jgi:hypothetical protein